MKSSKVNAILRFAEAGIASLALWFVGWLTYDLFRLVQWISPKEFNNLLSLSIVVAIVTGFELARRSLTTAKKTSNRAHNPKPQNPDGELEKVREELAEVKEELADLKAFKKVEAKRKEAQ